MGNPLSDLIGSALQGIPHSLGDLVAPFNPFAQVHQIENAVGGEGDGRQRLVMGLGAALGLGSLVGARVYHRWQSGEPLLIPDETGALSLGRRAPAEYHPLDERTQSILNATDYDQLAGYFGHTAVTPRAQLAGFLQSLGDRVTSEVPAHREAVASYQSPDHAAFAAGKWELAKVDALHRQGVLPPEMAAAHEQLTTNPGALFADPQRARDYQRFISQMAQATSDVEVPSMALPPTRQLIGVEDTPAGPRVAVAHREQMVPARENKDTLTDRLNSYDYEAAVPQMTQNLLRIKGIVTSETEIQKGLAWYSRANTVARQMAKVSGMTVEQAAGVISALSPQTDWYQNARAAMALARNGGTLPVGYADPVTGSSLLGSNVRNAERIAGGAAPDSVLTAEKTGSFWRNIADPFDPENKATIDRHSFEAGLGFKAGVDKPPIFEPSGQGRAAYAAFDRAHQIAAAIEGLAANQVQAITWLPIQAIKADVPPGVAGEAAQRIGAKNIARRTELQGRLEGLGDQLPGLDTDRRGFVLFPEIKNQLFGQDPTDNVVGLLSRSQTEDLGTAPGALPVAGRSNKLNRRHVWVEVVEPTGGSSIYAPPLEDLGLTLRGHHPIELAGDNVRWVASKTRAVTSVDEHLARASEEVVDRHGPVPHVLEAHTGLVSHPAMVPGNHIVVEVPLEQRAAVEGLANELQTRGFPVQVSNLAGRPADQLYAFNRYEPELNRARIGPSDVEGWSPRRVEQEMGQRQWVGISAWLGGSDPEGGAATARLEATLRARGYDPIPVDGHYDGHERSFIVFGMSNAEAMELGKAYGQESVVSPKGLLYTTGKQRGTYNPADGPVVAQPRNADNYFTEMSTGKGRSVKFQLPLDFSATHPIGTDLDAASKPSPRPHTAIWVDLGATPGADTVQSVWDLVNQHAKDTGAALKPAAYLHGDIAPADTQVVYEHHVADTAGNRGILRTGKWKLSEINSAAVHVPTTEAKAYAGIGNDVALGTRRTLDVRPATGRFGDALVNGEVRLVIPDPNGKITRPKGNITNLKVDGKSFSRFALYLPEGDLPVLAVGPDALATLQARFPDAQPHRIAGVRVTRSGVEITSAPALTGRPDVVLGNEARELLARLGVETTRTRLADKPVERAL